MDAAIVLDGVSKRFGAVAALDGLDLHVPAGTVYAVLGPNGAGKTTAVRVLTTLTRPDAGTVTVDGVDVVRHPARVRSRIGVCSQHATVDGVLTGRENLVLVGRLSGLSRRASHDRARRLLDDLDLSAAADRSADTYSGGMRRRLDLAAAVIARPRVLFLDEPTTGLDPVGRAALWRALSALTEAGVTILLTTQYLEEADEMADRVAVVAAGRVVAEGTSAELKRQVAQDRLVATFRRDGDLPPAVHALARAGLGEPAVDGAARRVQLTVRSGTGALMAAASALAAAGIEPVDLAVRRPSLDDVFHRLVGPAGAGRRSGGGPGTPPGMPPGTTTGAPGTTEPGMTTAGTTTRAGLA